MQLRCGAYPRVADEAIKGLRSFPFHQEHFYPCEYELFLLYHDRDNETLTQEFQLIYLA